MTDPFTKAYNDAIKLLKKHEKETQAIILALALAAAGAGVVVVKTESVPEL